MKFNLKIHLISKIFYLLFIFIASIVLYPNLSSSNTNGSIGGKTGSHQRMTLVVYNVTTQQMEIMQIFIPIYPVMDMFQTKHTQFQPTLVKSVLINLDLN